MNDKDPNPTLDRVFVVTEEGDVTYAGTDPLKAAAAARDYADRVAEDDDDAVDADELLSIDEYADGVHTKSWFVMDLLDAFGTPKERP